MGSLHHLVAFTLCLMAAVPIPGEKFFSLSNIVSNEQIYLQGTCSFIHPRIGMTGVNLMVDFFL